MSSSTRTNGTSTSPSSAVMNDAPPSYASVIASSRPPAYTPSPNTISYSDMQPFANPDLSPQHQENAVTRDPVTLTDAEINAMTDRALIDTCMTIIMETVNEERRMTTVPEAAVLAKLKMQMWRCLARQGQLSV